MNKADLIEAIALETGLSKIQSKKALEAAVKSVSQALVDGERVTLIGFGSFSVQERDARIGINPATQQRIKIGAKKQVKFKAGLELKEALN